MLQILLRPGWSSQPGSLSTVLMFLLGVVVIFPEQSAGLRCYQCTDKYGGYECEENKWMKNGRYGFDSAQVEKVDCPSSTDLCVSQRDVQVENSKGIVIIGNPRLGCVDRNHSQCYLSLLKRGEFGCTKVTVDQPSTQQEIQFVNCTNINNMKNESSIFNVTADPNSTSSEESISLPYKVACVCDMDLCNDDWKNGPDSANLRSEGTTLIVLVLVSFPVSMWVGISI